MNKLHLLAAFMLFCITSLAQAPATLKLNKGAVYQLESKIHTNSITNYMGQDMESKVDMTSKYELKVADVSDNQYTINSAVTALKMDMTNAGQQMQYDSDDSTNTGNPMAAGLQEVLNKQQTITINKSGMLISGVADSSITSPIMKQLENSGFGSNLAFVPVPKNVKAGDTWTVTEGDSTGVMNTVHYTVKSVRGNLVNLDFTGATKSNLTVEANGMEIKTKTEGTSEGTAVVDKSGVLQSSKATVKASGTVSVMGQEMPTSTVVESETTVKKLK